MPAPLDPGRLYLLDFERFSCDSEPQVPDWRDTDYANNGHAFRIACPPRPVFLGTRSARFQLNRGDWITDGSARAELKTQGLEPVNAVRWYAFNIYLEEWPHDSNSGEILVQWHQQLGLGSPPLSIEVNNSRWRVVRLADWSPGTVNVDPTDAGPCEFQRWTNWIVYADWREDESGTVKAWIKVASYTPKLASETSLETLAAIN
jgi:hypothetical protein